MNLVICEVILEDVSLIVELICYSWVNKVVFSFLGYCEVFDYVQEDLQYGGVFILFSGEMFVGLVCWLLLDIESDVWEICCMGIVLVFWGECLFQYLMEVLIYCVQLVDVCELWLVVCID